MAVDCVVADSQFDRDLLIGLTRGDEVEDGEFAERELIGVAGGEADLTS